MYFGNVCSKKHSLAREVQYLRRKFNGLPCLLASSLARVLTYLAATPRLESLGPTRVREIAWATLVVSEFGIVHVVI